MNLFCRYESLPEDLVYQHGRVFHVFPEIERKWLNPATSLHIFRHFSNGCKCVFFFLTTGPVGPALPLSPCMPTGPWNRRQAQYLCECLWLCIKCSGDLFTACVAYQWTRSPHCTGSTGFTLQNTNTHKYAGLHCAVL